MSGVNATVVVVNVSDIHPIVNVELTFAELLADEVCLTFTVSPLFTVHAHVVYAHPLILYDPQMTLIALAVFIHETVIAADSVTVLNATFVLSTNVSASGVVSGVMTESTVILFTIIEP